MSEKLKAGVVGVGHMGRHHVRIYSELPDVELIGVVDKDKTRAEEYGKKYNCFATDNLEEIIDKIDIASVAVPTVSHLEVVERLIKNHKHILIEKPLAPNTEEGKKIIDLANRYNVIVQVGHTERFNPVVKAIRKMGVSPQFI